MLIVEVDDLFLWSKYICSASSLKDPYDGINVPTRLGYMFRGQSNAEWPIESTFRRVYCNRDGFRLPITRAAEAERALRIKELNIVVQFQRDAYRYLSHEPCDSIEWLSIMRHYGAPTRVIDFSESPFVALHFAVVDNSEQACAVWAMPLEDTWKIRKMATKGFCNKKGSVSRARQYAKALMKQMPWFLVDWERENYEKYEYVNHILERNIKGEPLKCGKRDAGIIILKPRYNNMRISAQAGLLVIPTVLSLPFMENLRNCHVNINLGTERIKEDVPIKLSNLDLKDFVRLWVRGEIFKFVFHRDNGVVEEALSFLNMSNISEKTLFPDITGISNQFKLGR